MCVAYNRNSNIYGYNVKNILTKCTLYIVPMLNPDGVNLVNGSLNFNSNAYTYARYIARKYPDIPFPSGWKANINGVDLNLQFPSGWENAKKIKFIVDIKGVFMYNMSCVRDMTNIKKTTNTLFRGVAQLG